MSTKEKDQRVRQLLGRKNYELLEKFNYEKEDIKSTFLLILINKYFRLQGYLSKKIESGSFISQTKDLLYFYVNNKTINPPKKLKKILSWIYKEFNSKAKYMVILNVEIDASNCSFNANN